MLKFLASARVWYLISALLFGLTAAHFFSREWNDGLVCLAFAFLTLALNRLMDMVWRQAWIACANDADDLIAARITPDLDIRIPVWFALVEGRPRRRSFQRNHHALMTEMSLLETPHPGDIVALHRKYREQRERDR